MVNTRAVDREPTPFVMAWSGDPWTVEWHPPATPPPGKPHGAEAICVADDGFVLISQDGVTWGWPGGRPEGIETWEETVVREIHEEACAGVQAARLLGFTRGNCLAGQEEGLVLTRAVFKAEVLLEPWEPQHETVQRRVVRLSELFAVLALDPGLEPVYARALHEAGFGSGQEAPPEALHDVSG